MNFVRETGPRDNGMGYSQRTFVSLNPQSPVPEETSPTFHMLEPEPEPQIDDDNVETESSELVSVANKALRCLPGERPWCIASTQDDCQVFGDDSGNTSLLQLTANTNVLVFAPETKTKYAQTRVVDSLDGSMTDGYVIASNLQNFRFV